MKKAIIGFICGILLTSSLAFASTYVAESPTFKVFVNGKEFHSDPPVVVVEGRTYLPLRAMGDALGVPVEWNEEAGWVEVGDIKPSPSAEPTAEPTKKPDQTGYKMYKEMPWCADFANFSDASLIASDVYSTDTVEGYMYVYSSYEVTEDELRDFVQYLRDDGYSLIEQAEEGMTFAKEVDGETRAVSIVAVNNLLGIAPVVVK